MEVMIAVRDPPRSWKEARSDKRLYGLLAVMIFSYAPQQVVFMTYISFVTEVLQGFLFSLTLGIK